MMKILTQKIQPILCGNYSFELQALVVEMLDSQPERRPSVHKILDKPFIKKHLGQILENTISLHDENMLVSSHQLKKSTSSRKLFSQRHSLSSLSNLVLTPKTCSSKNNTEYVKIVEYKQNYPMILEENRHLKIELEAMKREKESLEDKTNALLQRIKESEGMGKEEML